MEQETRRRPARPPAARCIRAPHVYFHPHRRERRLVRDRPPPPAARAPRPPVIGPTQLSIDFKALPGKIMQGSDHRARSLE